MTLRTQERAGKWLRRLTILESPLNAVFLPLHDCGRNTLMGTQNQGLSLMGTDPEVAAAPHGWLSLGGAWCPCSLPVMLCSGHLAFVLSCLQWIWRNTKTPQPRPLISSTNCSFICVLLFFVLAKHSNKTKTSRTASFSAQFQRLRFLVTGNCVPEPTAGQSNTVTELCGGCHGRQEASRMDLEGARERRCRSKDMLPMACFFQWVPISHDWPFSQMLSCYKSIQGWIHWLSQRPQDLITSPKHASCWKKQNTWSHNRQFTFKCNSLHWHLLVESLYCLHLVLKMVSAPPTSTTVSANSKQGNKKDGCTQDRKIHEQHLSTLGVESLTVSKVCIWLSPIGLSCVPLTSVITDTLCP